MQALAATSAEEDNHDGNQKLALIGNNLIRFTLSFVAYENMCMRGPVFTGKTSFPWKV